jgi:hypothetical protein
LHLALLIDSESGVGHLFEESVLISIDEPTLFAKGVRHCLKLFTFAEGGNESERAVVAQGTSKLAKHFRSVSLCNM